MSWNGGGSCPSGKSRLQVYKTGPLYKILNSERDIMKEIRDNGPVQGRLYFSYDSDGIGTLIYNTENVKLYFFCPLLLLAVRALF